MITAFASTETAVEAMRLGACDYLSKPFDIDLLKMKVREKVENRQLRQENVLLKRTLGLSHQFSNIIGRSQSMLDVFKMIETVARTNSTILLTGESGTGKGLVAQAIHFHSLRREKPMVSLNCGAMPETLLESELFGHMRGAFTGADANKKGLLEVAEKGTIFLDEIGEMSPVMQVKLLRVLQERRFRRVGGLEELQADIRVIAATNQDLGEGGRRRALPRGSLLPHQRHPDRAAAAARAPRGHSAAGGTLPREVRGADGEAGRRRSRAPAMDLLTRHDWPGNIRELENVIERAVALEATPTVLPESLPPAVRGGVARAGAAPAAATRAARRAGLRSRGARPGDRARIHCAGARARRRRAGEGGGTARHELPVVPLLREEIQPEVSTPRSLRGIRTITNPGSATQKRNRGVGGPSRRACGDRGVQRQIPAARAADNARQRRLTQTVNAAASRNSCLRRAAVSYTL